MFPYNIVETQGEALIHACAERNIGFIAMKPLAGGAIDDPVLALRFIAANPDVTVVIPGMATVDEINENKAAIYDPAPLTENEHEKLQTIRDQLGTQFCRRCNYCAPCTAGIGISVQFLLEGYYTRYNLQDWAQQRYDAQDKKASDCIGCGACEPRCPYQLPIRDMMKRVAALFEKK
jgi:predicted aldo/keto reductase-like oxidoreductase